jgi:hypothetical protein
MMSTSSGRRRQLERYSTPVSGAMGFDKREFGVLEVQRQRRQLPSVFDLRKSVVGLDISASTPQVHPASRWA